MSCFSVQWLFSLIVWLIIVGAIFAILRLFVPYLVTILSNVVGGAAANLIVQVIRIVIWAAIAIIVCYIIFELIQCLWGMAGGLPSLSHGR